MKLIFQYDKCGEYMGFFFGEQNAEDKTGIKKHLIIRSCEGNGVKAGGFYFSYKRILVFKKAKKHERFKRKQNCLAKHRFCNEHPGSLLPYSLHNSKNIN